MSDTTPSPVLTSREAAALLKVSERTLYTLRMRHGLTGKLVGGSVRYLREDLIEFVRSQCGALVPAEGVVR